MPPMAVMPSSIHARAASGSLRSTGAIEIISPPASCTSFVVSSAPFDLAECRTWFEKKGVAVFKTPERVVQLDELPLLAAGKPDRAALKQRAARS